MKNRTKELQFASLRGSFLAIKWPSFCSGRFKCFVDEAALLEHPALLKRHRLARTSRGSDREQRPSGEELRRLTELVRRPRRHLSSEEKELLFRFRWSLTEQKGALTKVLHAVDWRDMEEGEKGCAWR